MKRNKKKIKGLKPFTKTQNKILTQGLRTKNKKNWYYWMRLI